MRTENWLNCHVRAFNYFGGVTRLLIPDNCKTATSSKRTLLLEKLLGENGIPLPEDEA